MGKPIVIKPRPYQQQAISAVESAFERGAYSVLLVACTGAGKTIISSQIMSVRLKQGKKCIFLAHREELLQQTIDKMAFVDENARGSITQGSRASASDDHVMVASVQTLAKRLHRINEFARPEELAICITDECHHATASTYKTVYDYLRGYAPECRMLGVTATPKRPDGHNLADVFEELVYQINMYDLIDQGFLTPIRGVTIESTVSLRDVGSSNGRDGFDYNERQLSLTVNCPKRNALVVDTYKQYGIHPKRGDYMKAIFFCVNVDHAESIAEMINKEQLRRADGSPILARAVYGDMGKDRRAYTMREYLKGNIHVLTNVNVLTEGFDDPTVECVVVARPTLSTVMYPQMVGRGVRLNPNDPHKECFVIDIVDRDGKGTQTLSGLFDLPPRLKLEGEDINRERKELRKLVDAHPFVDWQEGEQMDRQKLMDLLAPSTLFEVAKGIEPQKHGKYLWQRVGAGKYAISLPDDNWAILERTALGNFALRIESAKIHSFSGTAEEALEKAGQLVEGIFPGTAYSLYYPPDYQFDEPASRGQKQLLHRKFRISNKELQYLRSKGEAVLLISRLSISKRLCSLDNRFPSGKYFSFSIPLIYFYDPGYLKEWWKDHDNVKYFLEDRRRIVQWTRLNKPVLWEDTITKAVTEGELERWAVGDEETFCRHMRVFLKEDLEYKILVHHCEETKNQRIS